MRPSNPCHRDLSHCRALARNARGASRPSPTVITTFPCCHLDQRERSHAAIIRPKKGILGDTRFLASLRNDSGGGIMTFALPGTMRFLASLEITKVGDRNDKKGRYDRERIPNDRGGYRDLPPLSSRPTGEISCGHHPLQERHPRQHEIFRWRFEMTGRGGIMTFALSGITRFFACARYDSWDKRNDRNKTAF